MKKLESVWIWTWSFNMQKVNYRAKNKQEKRQQSPPKSMFIYLSPILMFQLGLSWRYYYLEYLNWLDDSGVKINWMIASIGRSQLVSKWVKREIYSSGLGNSTVKLQLHNLHIYIWKFIHILKIYESKSFIYVARNTFFNIHENKL